MNANYIAHRLVPSSERTVDENVVIETRRIDNGFVMKDIVVRGPNRPSSRYTERVKLYSRDKLLEMLTEAGLSLDAVYGNYEEGIYDAQQSPRMIMVGHKK